MFSHFQKLKQNNIIKAREHWHGIHKGLFYLFINISSSPETSNGVVIRIRGDNGRGRGPNIIHILHNDEKLTMGFVPVNENRDFLVNGVGLKEKLTFGLQPFLNEFILH